MSLELGTLLGVYVYEVVAVIGDSLLNPGRQL
jgi:hypothetical protein